MYSIFCALHPPNGLSKGVGVVKKCVDAFRSNFPSYNENVLLCTARMFTNKRLKQVNKDFNVKKKKEKKKKKKEGKKGTKKAKAKNQTWFLDDDDSDDVSDDDSDSEEEVEQKGPQTIRGLTDFGRRAC